MEQIQMKVQEAMKFPMMMLCWIVGLEANTLMNGILK